MTLFLLALAILFVGGILCLTAVGHPRLARALGPSVTVIGCLCGLTPVLAALAGIELAPWYLPWTIPGSAISVNLDALSAIFALPILILCPLAAIYGTAYLKPFAAHKDLAPSWCCFNLLAGSMLLVVAARNAVLFLLAWEIMSLSSFFLVVLENEHAEVRRAGWTYLVATHLGTALLLPMFALLGRHGNTMDFNGFTVVSTGYAATIFLLALVGFGTKAGLIPVHVWLPEAHPAAPSHVSAVMSGVMIKTGIYGLLRTLTFLGPPPPWWGWTLVGIGCLSGILGVLLALAQHDLKRLLAYSSVENIGIILLGIGGGLLGISYSNPGLAFLGFAGGLLHIINHAMFKGLLFLSAGSVLHATGIREMDRLGGLLKAMPVTGGMFFIGAIAICALPPLNGFASEFMIYLGALNALTQPTSLPALCIAGAVLLGTLALIGGLAAACFTKAFGLVFLGEPRCPDVRNARESSAAMRIPLATLATLCILLGLSLPWLPVIFVPAISILSGSAVSPAWTAVGQAWVAIPCLVLGATLLAGILFWARQRLRQRRPDTQSVTWDCGYAAPTPRMQYTASSFSDPIVQLFKSLLHTRVHTQTPNGPFPDTASWATKTPDFFHERVFGWFFKLSESLLSHSRLLQHGRLNLYILYIVLALLVLFFWKL